MENVIYATSEGKKKLEKYLEELISRRQGIAESVRVAAEYGDLKENAEWAAAREAQTDLEDEINGTREKLLAIKTFSYSKADTSAVNVGTRVRIEEVGSKRVEEWVITGVVESDSENKLISNVSPLGMVLLGKKVGDIVEVKRPVGKVKFKIAKISAGA
jgi:transcription elongation factor GreA